MSLTLAAVPANADTIYDNGPINGTTDAWTINFGFAVSNSFTVGSGGATITDISFGEWSFPGDVLLSVEVLITSEEFGGTTFYDQIVDAGNGLIRSNCTGNQYGFNTCTETLHLPNPPTLGGGTLAGGVYWLTLQNAETNTGDPIYWDENSGPSSASENSVGTIPSESFTILGTNGTSSTTSSTGTVPEPSSILLLAAGILGAAGMLRRKLL